jgi:hypothetical protein
MDARGAISAAVLPPLSLEEWKETRDTLHLYIQIVGKVRLASAPPQNHWWHCPLYVSARGLTTRRMRSGDVNFEIDFDLIEHKVVVRDDRGDESSFPLRHGLSVASFYDELFAQLARLDVRPSIKAEPYGVPMSTLFSEDTDHACYDADSVQRFWRVLSDVDWVFQEFSGWFRGKSSPVHLFWHSLDLAVTRFSGRQLPEPLGGDAVSREAYSDEVISFGFGPATRRCKHPRSTHTPRPSRTTSASSRFHRSRPSGRKPVQDTRQGSGMTTYAPAPLHVQYCSRSCRVRMRRAQAPRVGTRTPSPRVGRRRPRRSRRSGPDRHSCTASLSTVVLR